MIFGVHAPHYTRDINLYFDLLNDLEVKTLRWGTGLSLENVTKAVNAGFSVIGTLARQNIEDLGLFGDYVKAQVTKFAGLIDGWIVFNEVNTRSGGTWTMPPAAYYELLKVAHQRIYNYSGGALTLTSNFLYGDRATQYMSELYEIGVAKAEPVYAHYDVVCCDPYCYPSAPEFPAVDQFGHGFWQLENLRSLMDEVGDPSQLFVVEFGYPTAGDVRQVTEEMQGDYIVRALGLAELWGIDRFYVYKFQDSAGEHAMGLIKENMTKKLSYGIIQEYLTGVPPTPPPPANAEATTNIETGAIHYRVEGGEWILLPGCSKHPVVEQNYSSGILTMKVIGCNIETPHYWNGSVNVITGIFSGWTRGEPYIPPSPEDNRFLLLFLVMLGVVGIVMIGSSGT